MVEECKRILEKLESVTDLKELEKIKEDFKSVIFYYDDDGK